MSNKIRRGLRAVRQSIEESLDARQERLTVEERRRRLELFFRSELTAEEIIELAELQAKSEGRNQ